MYCRTGRWTTHVPWWALIFVGMFYAIWLMLKVSIYVAVALWVGLVWVIKIVGEVASDAHHEYVRRQARAAGIR